MLCKCPHATHLTKSPNSYIAIAFIVHTYLKLSLSKFIKQKIKAIHKTKGNENETAFPN